MSVAEQAHAFAAMALCGALSGAIHDVLGLFRRGAWSTASADLLLGLLCAGGVIGMGLVLSCDVFRLYTLLGMAAGWALYACSVGTAVRFLTERWKKLSNRRTK